MSNYQIWKNEFGDKMVEVYNKADLSSVQEIFTKQGYIIIETFSGRGNHWYFIICKPEEE